MTQHDGLHGETPLGTSPRSGTSEARSRHAATALETGAWDEEGDRRGAQGRSFGALLFVPCFLLFVASLVTMGYAVDIDSGLLFGLATLAAGVAFMVPMHVQRR